MGISFVSLRAWTLITRCVVVFIIAAVVVSYVLNGCVALGLYGPARRARLRPASVQDYEHYDASSTDGRNASAPAPGLAPGHKGAWRRL